MAQLIPRWETTPEVGGTGRQMSQFQKRNQKKEREIGGLVKTHGSKSKVGGRKFLPNFLKAFGFK
jgi:uncharacterized protein YmfQ (DUF2313 family)